MKIATNFATIQQRQYQSAPEQFIAFYSYLAVSSRNFFCVGEAGSATAQCANALGQRLNLLLLHIQLQTDILQTNMLV